MGKNTQKTTRRAGGNGRDDRGKTGKRGRSLILREFSSGGVVFKDDTLLYGIDFFMKGQNKIETAYKTKENWLAILKLLDERLWE